jgi:predicted TIM-barrel fold metal-dependent hydrolase
VALPSGIGVVDLMIGPANLDYLNASLMSSGSHGAWSAHPAEYMFKDVPPEHNFDPTDESEADRLIEAMDKFSIEKGLISFSPDTPWSVAGIKKYPDRLIPSLAINPNRGMDEVRRLVYCRDEFGIRAATCFPAGLYPQVPINDKKFFPLYAKCVELDLPIFLTTGVPGPRVPYAAQDPALLDEVCWFFPELKIVMRHGAEPWADLAVKLMLKYPNLYYSTSAFAPKYYPKPVVHFANTRGRDKIMYAGYYPLGFSLERTFSELPDVPFRDEVWPLFLRENALRVLGLD